MIIYQNILKGKVKFPKDLDKYLFSDLDKQNLS
jgi:hypothetical protein